MRSYGKVSPGFWIGETGKLLRTAGRDAQTIALYFITSPSSNMLGMYYLPLPTLYHEVGISKEGASMALRRVCEANFAFYDEVSEYVWVPEMAKWQIGPALQPNDNQVTGIKKELETLRKSPFFNEFLNKYREPFHLQNVAREPRPFEASSMPHRSQEQEQEQEQDNKSGAKAPESSSSISKKRKRSAPPDLLQQRAFNQFYEAYPKHVNKADAEKAWLEINPDPELTARIMKAVLAYADEVRNVEQRFIKHPGPWLRAKRWEDELPVGTGNGSTRRPSIVKTDEETQCYVLEDGARMPMSTYRRIYGG